MTDLTTQLIARPNVPRDLTIIGHTMEEMRRELIAWRVTYRGNRPVTTRISNLVGQIENLVTAESDWQRANLRAAIALSHSELVQIIRVQERRYIAPDMKKLPSPVHANHGAAR